MARESESCERRPMTTARSRSGRTWATGAICAAVLAGIGNIGVGGLVVLGWSLQQEAAVRENEWSPMSGALLLAYAASLGVLTGFVALVSGLAAWRSAVRSPSP